MKYKNDCDIWRTPPPGYFLDPKYNTQRTLPEIISDSLKIMDNKDVGSVVIKTDGIEISIKRKKL